MSDEPKPFRILSIDGGGMKGSFAAGFLAEAERLSSRRIVDHFDLVVGTSTGGIIALAVTSGVPAADVRRFYVTDGPSIFPRPLSLWDPRSWPLGRPVHSGKPLDDALRKVFGGRLLGQALAPTMVPALRVDDGTLHVIKTPHAPRFVNDQHLPLVDVARATSAAPLYLPPYRAQNGSTYLDGGLAVNNPACLGVAEAIDVFGKDRGSIRVLSIASPEEPFALPKKCGHETRSGFGIRGWNLKSVSKAFSAGQDAALSGLAKFIIPSSAVCRVSISVSAGSYSLDNPSRAGPLADLGAQECVKRWNDIGGSFFDEAVAGRTWPSPAPAA
jgi:hypothetical protein